MKRVLIFIVFLFVGLVGAESAVFSGYGTEHITLTISNAEIEDLELIISGRDNGGFVSNVTLDVLDDGIIDWEYKVYNSEDVADFNELLYVWSSQGNQDYFDYYDSVYQDPLFTLNTLLGQDTNDNFVRKSPVSTSAFALFTPQSHQDQVLSFVTYNKTIHAFLPSYSSTIASSGGYYFSEGGNSYYCSDDNGTFSAECNLDVNSAVSSNHIARQADLYFFNFSETYKNYKLVEEINNYLKTCSNPCNIPVRIDSESAGILDLSISDIIYAAEPAEINLIEGLNYDMEVNSEAGLTEVSYFYGDMPDVFVIPFVNRGDLDGFSINQTDRYILINNSIVEEWDRMTDNKHPLNFTIYQEPYEIDFDNGSYNNFSLAIREQVVDVLQTKYPSIFIFVDIRDYFNGSGSFSQRYSSGDTLNIINIHGIDKGNKHNLRYGGEVVLNEVLHELGHSFISYPVPDNRKLFFGNHPASFSEIFGIPTYGSNESFDGDEGYYEPYSIMNQLRVFMSNLSIAEREFSYLDLSLMGVLSPDLNYNYSFYSGSIRYINGEYVASGLSNTLNYGIKEVYGDGDMDSDYWDVRDTNRTSVLLDNETHASFSVSKNGQEYRALWVVAKDGANQNHFKVFNNNAKSIATYVGEFDWVSATDYPLYCLTNADTNGNNKIDMSELLVYIGKWNTGQVYIGEIAAAIKAWDTGIGC
jgi:hypothetical protein